MNALILSGVIPGLFFRPCEPKAPVSIPVATSVLCQNFPNLLLAERRDAPKAAPARQSRLPVTAMLRRPRRGVVAEGLDIN